MDIESKRSMADNLADLRDDVRVLREHAKDHAPRTCEHAQELLDRLHVQVRVTDGPSLAELLAEFEAHVMIGASSRDEIKALRATIIDRFGHE